MKNKTFLLGILAIVLIFTMTVAGCDFFNDLLNNIDDKGSLGGTRWTRSVKTQTSNMIYQRSYDLTFVDASNATIREYGYTTLNNKTTTTDETTNYTYKYSSEVDANGWQGALESKSSSHAGYVFKISGNTLTTMTTSGTVTWTKD